MNIEGNPGVRLNFQCISIKDVGEAESSTHSESFIEGVKSAIEIYNRQYGKNYEAGHPSEDWYKTIYYTNEDDGYYFYFEEDLAEEDE